MRSRGIKSLTNGKLWEEEFEDDAVEGETFHINDLVQEGEADD